MASRGLSARFRSLCLVAAGLVAWNASAWAGHDVPAPLGVTLKTWEEAIWNRITDRDGNILGPRDGILQRFDTRQDEEYRLDLRADGFGVLDDFLWHHHPDGLRFWIGSLNNPTLALLTEVKKVIPLGETWSLTFQFFQEGTFESQRSLPIFTFENTRLRGTRGFVFVALHPKSKKASVDAEVGGGYRWGPEAFLQVSVAALDLFNDTTLSLSRSEGFVSTEEAEYVREPYALRASGSVPLPSRFRLEVAGGLVTSSDLSVRFPARQSDNVRFVGEAFFYGGLLEWRPRPEFSGSLAVTRERAVEERDLRDPARNLEDRHLTEETRRVSAVVLTRPAADLLAELWLEWTERPEERRFPSNPSATIDHRDWEFLGSLDLTYRLSRRVDLLTRYLTNDRKAEGIPGLRVTGQNDRLTVRTRFRFTPQTTIAFGANWDLDYGGKLFDGGSLTLLSLW